MSCRKWIGFLCVIVLVGLFLSPGEATSAQEEVQQGPVYIVQEGDTLWDIAQRFGVPWHLLARENNLDDPSRISAGMELIIPGLDGLEGYLITQNIPFGETLRSLSRRFEVPVDLLIRLNKIINPVGLYAGENLILPQSDQEIPAKLRLTLAPGQSLLELSVRHGMNPWKLVNQNALPGTWSALPGDVLQVRAPALENGPGALPGEVRGIEIDPVIPSQGDTVVIRLSSPVSLVMHGTFMDHDLHFFQTGEGDYVALQGIHAMAEPGLYPLTLWGQASGDIPIGFTQMVRVAAGDFAYESLQVPPETLDPKNTAPEDKIWYGIPARYTPEKMWEGVFLRPVAPSDCGYTDYFGNRRSYNGSAYNFFHTGLDFCYNYNLEVNEIYAPADGIVVYADGPLVVRGYATMIDHGWGVYTGYMHQEKILVQVGERVKAGQLIGIVGVTPKNMGRVSGPHLHFEVWVGGVQVDPLDWLEREYP